MFFSARCLTDLAKKPCGPRCSHRVFEMKFFALLAVALLSVGGACVQDLASAKTIKALATHGTSCRGGLAPRSTAPETTTTAKTNKQTDLAPSTHPSPCHTPPP